MKNKILQVNINYSWAAHDLLMQYLLENGISICIIAEPVHIPDSPAWFCSTDKKAAIYVNYEYFKDSLQLFSKGRNYVAVKCDNYIFTSVYISPNISTGRFLLAMDELSDLVVKAKNKVIISGDFNAKSSVWASRTTDVRGELVEEWSAECELRLINAGAVPTCVRAQSTSIVDLTWCTADIVANLLEWKVEDRESLSDHAYISFVVQNNLYSLASKLPIKHPIMEF